MIDIRINEEGDFDITPAGDIQISDNPLQDARIAILWIAGEWRLRPNIGLPWFEEILVKNADPYIVSQRIREALLSIEDIDDADVDIEEYDIRNRTICFKYTIYVNEESYSEEVEIDG